MTLPSITTNSESKLATAGTSLTCTAPSGITDGDLLILHLVTDNLTSDDPITIANDTAGATWVKLVEEPFTGQVTGSIWYKIAASESGTYTASWTDTVEAIAWILRISDADNDTPFRVTPSVLETSSTAIPTTAITTVTNNNLALAFFACDDDDVTVDGGISGTGWSVGLIDESAASSTSCSGGYAEKDMAATGSTGVCTLTLTAAEQSVAFCLAVQEVQVNLTKGGPVSAMI
jgi:hypothetical protein